VTTLVSTGAFYSSPLTAVMTNPRITPDGRYVALVSTAKGLVGTNAPVGGEVYVRDLVAGGMTCASSNALSIVAAVFGTTNRYSSYHPSISDNGRFVTFKSFVTNAYTPAFRTNTAILQSDLISGTTTVIDTNAFGTGPDEENRFGPEMTPDGRYIVYVRREPDANGVYSSVHVWDSQTATDILVSTDGIGVPAGTVSDTPAISPDGRFVVFLSDATNLVANAVGSGFHIYLRDLQSATTQLVDVDTNGVGSTDMAGAVPSLSADGRYVVFAGPDGSLVALDNNRRLDVFLRDTIGGTTTRVSRRDPSLVPSTGDGITRLTSSSVSLDG